MAPGRYSAPNGIWGHTYMNFTTLLDGASKVAAGVGVVLGLSYAAGLFKMIGFYSSFGAEWLFESMDVQGFINEGLPLVMMLLTTTVLHIIGLHKAAHRKHKKWMLIFLVVISSLICVTMKIPGYEEGSNLNGYSAAIGMAGAAFLAWVFHEYSHSKSQAFNVMSATGALLIILGAAPYLAGKAKADVVQNGRDGSTEIVNANNRIVGVLVRFVGGKYLILDCNVSGQMRFQEPSPSLFLRRSSGRCKATL